MPSLAEVISGRQQDFFIQDKPKGYWHVESEEHCEYMLCGYFISVEQMGVKIQNSWGPSKCPDCWMLYERRRRTVFK